MAWPTELPEGEISQHDVSKLLLLSYQLAVHYEGGTGSLIEGNMLIEEAAKIWHRYDSDVRLYPVATFKPTRV